MTCFVYLTKQKTVPKYASQMISNLLYNSYLHRLACTPSLIRPRYNSTII